MSEKLFFLLEFIFPVFHSHEIVASDISQHLLPVDVQGQGVLSEFGHYDAKSFSQSVYGFSISCNVLTRHL